MDDYRMNDSDSYYDYNSYENSAVFDSSENGSASSHVKNQRKLREEYKSLDKGYLKIYRRIDYKRTEIEAYKTPYTSYSKIRNACTGCFQNFRVGTTDEYMFYKVALATGETGQDYGHLYYDNPEQYERHFYATVPQEEKEKWDLRYRAEKYNQMELEKTKKEQQKRTYEHNYIVK